MKIKILEEFKQFAMRGNVVDMAVGIIIGGAFGKIVSSLVADIIMPPIGLLIGGVNFTELKIPLKAAVFSEAGKEVTPAVAINYGTFLQTTLDFIIIAFSIFLMVKLLNRFHTQKKEEAAPAAPPADIQLLTEIRDLLKNKSSSGLLFRKQSACRFPGGRFSYLTAKTAL